MTRVPATTVLLAFGLLLPSAASPQTITANTGQSTEQVAADQAACAGEAAAQSGYNPAAAPAAAEPVRGERARGAARGAAAGAVREERTDADEREVDDVAESAARLGAAAGGAPAAPGPARDATGNAGRDTGPGRLRRHLQGLHDGTWLHRPIGAGLRTAEGRAPAARR